MINKTRMKLIISIHTPLAGSDSQPDHTDRAEHTISIHTPLAGSDSQYAQEFLIVQDFNPHSPRGE